MQVHDNEIHKREINAFFEEEDLVTILINKIVEEYNFPFDARKTKISFFFEKKDHGSEGHKTSCRFSLINDLSV